MARPRTFACPDGEARARFAELLDELAFAELLDELAEAVRVRADQDRTDEEFDDAVRRCGKLLDELDQRVHAATPDALDRAVGLAGMLVPARHALRDLRAD